MNPWTIQGDLPNPGISPRSPTLQADSLPAQSPGNPKNTGVGSHPFSRGSSWPRNRTGVSCIAGRFSTNWAIREVPKQLYWGIIYISQNPLTVYVQLNSFYWITELYNHPQNSEHFHPSKHKSLAVCAHLHPHHQLQGTTKLSVPTLILDCNKGQLH